MFKLKISSIQEVCSRIQRINCESVDERIYEGGYCTKSWETLVDLYFDQVVEEMVGKVELLNITDIRYLVIKHGPCLLEYKNFLSVKEICRRISRYIELNCDGCTYEVSSLKFHTCYTSTWKTSVALYFNQVLEDMNNELTNKTEIKDLVLKYGPGSGSY